MLIIGIICIVGGSILAAASLYPYLCKKLCNNSSYDFNGTMEEMLEEPDCNIVYVYDAKNDQWRRLY